MTLSPLDADIRRRSLVTIATSTYEDAGLPPLTGVDEEVATLLGWLCARGLGDRQFTHRHPGLAKNPSRDEVRRALENPGRQDRLRHTDAAVVYVTGHGLKDHNTHWLAFSDTEASRLFATGLKTEDLVGWLRDTNVQHLLLIIDVCYAGEVIRPILAQRGDPPDSWLVIPSASKDQQAGVGALSGAIRDVLDELGRAEGGKYDNLPFLKVVDFIDEVNQRLGKDQRVAPAPNGQLNQVHQCLPNPHFTPSLDVELSPSRHDLALPRADVEAHWGPRSRGVVKADEPGWLFTGRAALMKRLIDAATGQPGTTLITGSAGSGKSAVLARLVTLSDSTFCTEYAAEVDLIDPTLRPPRGVVDAAVLCTGKRTVDIMAQLCHAVGAPIGTSCGTVDVEGAVRTWQSWIQQTPRLLTVVVDALDEADDPTGVLRSALGELQPPEGEPKVRLIVGVRSPGGHQQHLEPQASAEARLADAAESILNVDPVAGRIRVDESPWWSRDDILKYALTLLCWPEDSPYRDGEIATKAVAEPLTDAAGKSFLLVRLEGARLAAQPEAVDPTDPTWLAALSVGAVGVFREELFDSKYSDRDRLRAVHLLRAVAFACGRGLPWRVIWPTVATAVADDPGYPDEAATYGDSDIAWLLGTRLGGYLISDTEDDVTIYRLFHNALRETLRDQWRDLLSPARTDQ